VLEYAEWLGIDTELEPDMLWIAREGLTAELPANWRLCFSEGDEPYYFNETTGDSTWSHPLDGFYQRLYWSERAHAVRSAHARAPARARTLANWSSLSLALARAQDGYGSPLCVAAARGHLAACELLIARGARIEPPEYLQDCGVPSPLWLACSHDHGASYACVGVLVVHRRAGAAPVVELLLRHGASAAYIADGVHCLSACAEAGAVRAARALLDAPRRAPSAAGAEASVPPAADVAALLCALNDDGTSAVYVAAACAHSELLALLLSRGADCNAGATPSQTPLFAAAEGGHAECVRLLLAAGCRGGVAGRRGVRAAVCGCAPGASRGVPHAARRGRGRGRHDEQPHDAAVLRGRVR
jgi:hypothetical protein